eukprot:3406500-Pyramimonas_sp.AAC.1
MSAIPNSTPHVNGMGRGALRRAARQTDFDGCLCFRKLANAMDNVFTDFNIVMFTEREYGKSRKQR